jgi:hypothetical protein
LVSFSCPALVFHLIEDVQNWHVMGVVLFTSYPFLQGCC